MFRKTLIALPLLFAVAAPALAQDATAEVGAVYTAFADRLNANDVQGLLALYADDAVFVPAPGQSVTGAEAIGGALGQFSQLSDTFTGTVRSIFVSGDHALAIVDWQLQGKDAQGGELTLGGATADVLKRSADGQWQFIIDNPFGTAAAN